MIKLTILLLYVLAAGLFIYALTRAEPGADKPALRLAFLSGVLAFAGHSVILGSALLSGAGVHLNIGNLVNLVGWQIGLFALVSARWPRMRGFSALCLPVAAVSAPFIGAASATAAASPSSWQIGSHVVLSVLAYALLNIAAILALFMVLQERAIRSRRPGWLARLMPPLEVLEQGLFICIGFGFFLLSLAIFSGLIFVEDLFAQHLVHKTALSIFGWLLFGTLLLGRWRFGWRGKTAAAWTLGGFAALLLAYFGSRIVLEFILGRQWGG